MALGFKAGSIIGKKIKDKKKSQQLPLPLPGDPVFSELSERLKAEEQQKQEPEKTVAPEEKKPNFTEPEIIRNADTGEPTFVKMPDGRVISVAGEKPEQVQDLVNKGNEKIATPKGAVEATDAQQVRENAQQQQEAISLLEQGQNVPANVDLSEDPEAATAALNTGTIVGGALATGGTFAAGGALVGGPAGAAIGGAIGALVGGFGAFLGKLAADKRQSTKEAFTVYKINKGERFSEVMNWANSGKVPPSQVQFGYEQIVSNMKASRASLREKTETLVGRQLSGAQEELIQVEDWLANEPNYRRDVILALSNPNPNIVYTAPEDEDE